MSDHLFGARLLDPAAAITEDIERRVATINRLRACDQADEPWVKAAIEDCRTDIDRMRERIKALHREDAPPRPTVSAPAAWRRGHRAAAPPHQAEEPPPER